MTYIECRFWRILYETRAIGLAGVCYGAHCVTDGNPVAFAAAMQADPTDGYSLPKRDAETLRGLPAHILASMSEPDVWADPHKWLRTFGSKFSCVPSPTEFKLSRLRRFGELVERYYFSTVVPEIDNCRPPPPAPWSRIAPLIVIVPAPVLKKGSSHGRQD